MAKFGVILVAAGRSTRFKDEVKKPFADIDGRAVWLRAADLFVNRDDVVQTLLVIAADDEENVSRRYGPNMAFMNVSIVLGGAERTDSVANGLAALQADVEYVVVHDAVRPCATAEMINKVFEAALEHQAAILAAPIHDTIKRAGKDHVIEATVPREHLWLAQTPQIFRRDLITQAYAQRAKYPGVTDDAQLVEAMGQKVRVVPSDLSNVKITTKSDLYLADAVIKSRPKPKNRAFHPFADDNMWR
jgi:2-C-methyl-D-erythritol 4-phosphate cytidylyltransferase